jgi:hypothetical protein
MKKEMEFQNKENYVAPEMDVMELNSESVMQTGSEEQW